MSGKLTAFLAEAGRRENVRLAVSERFVDEEGRPQLWELAPLTAADLQELLNQPGDGEKSAADISLQLLAKAVVWPDLHNAQLQDSYGVMGAEQLLLAMLSPGEYQGLQEAFAELNLQGLDLRAKVAAAKN